MATPQGNEINYDALIDNILAKEVPNTNPEQGIPVEEEQMVETETQTEEGIPEEPIEETLADEVGEPETTEEEQEMENEIETAVNEEIGATGGEGEEEMPTEETTSEEGKEEITEEITEETTGNEDIDEMIEKELALINRTQDKVEEIQETIEANGEGEDTNALQMQLDELRTMLADREVEIEQTKKQLGKYKDRLTETNSFLADQEINNITTKPILDTVEKDQDLKGAILSLSKAEETGDEYYKDQALNNLYDFIQKEAGIDIRKMMGNKTADRMNALGSADGSASVEVVETKQKDDIDNILNNALGI